MYLLYLLYRPVLFYSGHAVQYEAGQSRSVYAMATISRRIRVPCLLLLMLTVPSLRIISAPKP
jgi:hypothetical protein